MATDEPSQGTGGTPGRRDGRAGWRGVAASLSIGLLEALWRAPPDRPGGVPRVFGGPQWPAGRWHRAGAVLAWIALFGLSSGVAALSAVQLDRFHILPADLAAALGLVTGLPLALLPVTPLLAWRIVTAGVLLALFAVATVGTPPDALWPWPAGALVVLPVVLYEVAATHPRRVTGAVGVVTVVGNVLAASPVVGTPLAQTAWVSAAAVAALALGRGVGGRAGDGAGR
ncbi:hypothetical protein FHX37_0364 [Haloactinospora alba]|uniref:Uncharacterized protein n=1 Tax=Haloactinospora alba TaxID=405555 RepID=A0A543NF69_9ACTN|nr:hypothetical protein [Haloactinospora alba]TQN30485.1 hypothetical protein FHX37_0364 [Haloactinospora alba]